MVVWALMVTPVMHKICLDKSRTRAFYRVVQWIELGRGRTILPIFFRTNSAEECCMQYCNESWLTYFLALIKGRNWVFLKQPIFTLNLFLFYKKPIAKKTQIVRAKAYWQPLHWCRSIEKGWKAAKFDRARSIGAWTSSVKPASERSGHWNGGEWDRQTVTALTSQPAPCNFLRWDLIFILNCHCLSTYIHMSTGVSSDQ